MPERHGNHTGDDSENRTTDKSVSRRRMLQVGAAGLAVGALGVTSAGASDSELSNTIIIDGSGFRGNANYEFLATGSVSLHPDEGSNENSESINGGHVTGSLKREIHAYLFSGTISHLDVTGAAEVTLLYGDDEAETDRLEIVAETDGSVDYEIRSSDTVEKILDNEDRSADDSDTVTETDDGTWIVDGSTESGYGDTYDFHGEIERFEPVTGEFTLFFNGEETTVTELTGQEVPEEEDDEETVDRNHWYSFEATGNEYADYYLEIEDGADMVASTIDDAVIDPDFHWINADGTKAAGRVQPGDTHAYAFDTSVADVTIDGEAHPTVDGSDSNLEYYPRSMASGDHWKGYFPWQIAGEERQHWYSFEATGDEYVDYYLEVEDGGETIPSLVNDAAIEYEFFWIGDDGTKAAGRVQPGDTHAYAFDTSLLDITIQGDAHAMVDGSDSNLGWFPQDGASGDGWKSGFPWQDDGEGVTDDGTGNVAIGGGSGYENTVAQSEADAVVRSRSELIDALSSASSGDIVYVPGGTSISMGDRGYHVPSGVTLASDRGIDGSQGALLSTEYEPDELIYLHGSARLTGIRVRGPHPGADFGGSSSAGGAETFGAGEIDNCEVWGFSHHGIQADSGTGAHFHHNVIRDCNKSGLGYGITADSGMSVIEYNYFNFNRHSIATTGDNPGYVCRYNHFGPETTDHVIDVHRGDGREYQIHNNVVEAVEAVAGGNREGRTRPAVTIRGVPADIADVHDNWFYNPDEPRDSPNGWTDEAITQVHVDEWTNVTFSDNAYGADANVSYSDIIPGYDGWRS